jgi:hypothetical protein
MFKHLVFGDLGWDFAPYFRYLETAPLPDHIRAFAADQAHYRMQDANSLHDSRLVSWTIRGVDRAIQIEACLLGQMYDRHIHLIYKNVRSYRLDNPAEYELPPKSGHGDLLVHELTVADDGLFVHVLYFSRGSTFVVEFADLEHRITLIA